MKPKILSKTSFIPGWIILAVTFYILICSIFYFLDQDILKVCTYEDDILQTDVSCPIGLGWYEVTAEAMLSLTLFIISAIYPIIWIFSIIFFKNGSKRIEEDINLFDNASSKRKHFKIFRLNLYFLPIFLCCFIFLGYKIREEILAYKKEYKYSYNFQMKNPQRSLDDAMYEKIAQESPDRCEFSKDFYIKHSEISSRASYLHVPDNALHGSGYIFVSHENDWDGMYSDKESNQKYATSVNEKKINFSDNENIYLSKIQKHVVEQTPTYIPGRRFDVRIVLSEDSASTGGTNNFSRVFPNNADCITVEVR